MPAVRLMFYVCCLTAITFGSNASDAQEYQTAPQQAAAALEIFDAWNNKNPEPAARTLHLIAWTPADREFPANHHSRLSRIMLHIQAFYETEMQRHGLGAKTFNLNTNQAGDVVIHDIRGNKPTAAYGKQSGSEIRKECVPVLAEKGIDADKATIVIFCNLATWDAQNLRFTHESPYYAGGSYRGGTAWQLDSPELDIDALSKKQPLIQDGQYGRISLGKHNSIFIGGIAHELGHALGLPHCAPRPDENRGTPLMGSGNRSYGDELRNEGRGSVLSFAHALRLLSHPQFSGSVKGFDDTVDSKLTELSIQADRKAISVSGVAAGSPPIYGVVAYFDPEGGGDYNSTTATAVPDDHGRFQLKTSALTAGKAGELRIFLLHCNGSIGSRQSHAQQRFIYTVDKQGEPDISAIQLRLELTPLVEAINAGNARRIEKVSAQLRLTQAKKIADRLLNPVNPTTTPADYRGTSNTVSLTDFKPTEVKVGWARPSFDRMPNSDLLLESNGQIFATGIYAHAPARHVYNLGGRWKTFRGFVGLGTGSYGSVVFVIKADGNVLATSNTITPDDLTEFELDVTGAKTLELITQTTDDGAASDWGLWLAPQLKR